MSSKLDEMRTQFRERLTIRPESQNRITVLKVENENNYNKNISDLRTDAKGANGQRSSNMNAIPKKSIPHLTANYGNKSSLIATKVSDSRDYDKLISKASVNSNKTTINKESKEWTDSRPKSLTKVHKIVGNSYANQELKSKNGLNEEIENRKQRKPMISLQTKLRLSSATDEPGSLNRAGSEGTPCRFCGRYFALSERLQKHETVCDSVVSKSRQQFDSTQQRFKGQPKEYIQSYERALTKSKPEPPKRWNWRQKHQYCLATIRSSRGGQSTGPTTSEIVASTQQKCDYCKRRFNDDAIQRHLPICAKLHHKKAMNF